MTTPCTARQRGGPVKEEDGVEQRRPAAGRRPAPTRTVGQSTDAACGCFLTEDAPTEMTAACEPRPSS